MIELNKIYNEDCLEGMKRIPDGSVDVVLTDPPYLYLKNQKLDVPFDETVFFDEMKRVLKKDGFIILFGRGTSFYRWNTMLADRGFNFKEEIVWYKRYCTSPLMAISRVHETVSIHCNGKGKILKNKVPYLEMKKYDIASICTDIKRLCTTFNNPKSLKAVQYFLENNRVATVADNVLSTSISSIIQTKDRCGSVMQGIQDGMNEKSIIRTDIHECNTFTKYGDRCCNVMQPVEFGMNEKDIIKEVREHYTAIHPTQKPVRLLERLLNLVCRDNITVLDPFSGGGSTAVACINTNRNFIGFEILPEYYSVANERIKEKIQQTTHTINSQSPLGDLGV